MQELMKVKLLSLLLIIIFLPEARSEESSPLTPVPIYTYRIIKAYPHDSQAFTQGLIFKDGFLYEGTGLNGKSELRKVKLETGAVVQRSKLPQEFFGEGITAVKDKIIQLTWKSQTAFVYDRKSFKLSGTLFYPTEGWGIAYDGEHVIMSDGSAYLYFLDPETFQETRRVEVRDDAGPVARLNELEYISGEVFANVWLKDRIARIDPKTGRVKGWLDLKGLSPFSDGKTTKVLNGIAYDAVKDRLFVTGKLWPFVYEIKLIRLQ
ncbi:MAG: glutaminyl-peptide cyclotransferase [Nitrospiraceae bacterium]|nr:MAG: glutaminyl-peptide cyclotransferase [Nitrospiraceae bacterium]